MLVLVILVLLDVHGKEMCQCIYARLSNTFNDNKSKFLTPYQFDYTVEVEYQKWFFESQNTQYDPVAYLGGGHWAMPPLWPDHNFFRHSIVSEPRLFLARDSIYVIARYMPSPVRLSVRPSVRPSVCLSVRHTGGSVKDV